MRTGILFALMIIGVSIGILVVSLAVWDYYDGEQFVEDVSAAVEYYRQLPKPIPKTSDFDYYRKRLKEMQGEINQLRIRIEVMENVRFKNMGVG